MLWLQLVASVPLAYLGARVGFRLGQGRGWWMAFAAAMGWVILVILGHRFPRVHLVAPVSWAVDIDIGPFAMAFVIPALFATLLPRLPRTRRAFIAVVAGIMVVQYAIIPAACPLAARPALAAMKTKINADGVCLQTRSYTCGPSAMVTCLRALGVAGDEGPLAIAARSGPLVGTDARFLAATINGLYVQEGIRAECSAATLPDQLPVPFVAAMDLPVIGGHFVAVLEVSETELVIGDPYSGRYRLRRETFLEQWTGIAICVSREGR